jgi:hypothetical protein
MADLWLRLSAETSNDPKLIGIAAAAKVPYAIVLGLWTHLLCRARKNPHPGMFTDTPQELACTLGLETSLVEDIMAHFEFHNRNLIEVNKTHQKISNWNKYQKSYDLSTERVNAWRKEQAAKNNPEKAAQIKQKQQTSDIITFHQKTNPHVQAAHALGVRIMTERGVLDKMELFNQLTSALTPLIESEIPESFIHQTITTIWLEKELRGNIPKRFDYYVPAVKQEWDMANQKLEGNVNGKRSYSTGSSRTHGEDEESRRKTILEYVGLASNMDTRRTSSG